MPLQSQPATRGMDVARSPKKRGRLYGSAGIGLVAVVGVTVAFSTLSPRDPVVDLSSLVVDSVSLGNMVREVRGPGTLVPEHMRLVSALTSARVERIVAQPGQVVTPGTVLLEMSNPDVQIQALQAQQALTEARSRLVDLKVQLEGARLTQEGTVASIHTLNVTAAQEGAMADSLLTLRMISRFDYNTKRATAEETAKRLSLERQRLNLMSQSVESQLAAQRRQIERLEAIATFQESRVRSLVVVSAEAGVVQELSLQPGQWVNGGTVVARIVRPDKLKAVLRIPETQAVDVAVGQQVRVDTRNGIVAGRVSRMDPASQSGSVTIDVALDGPLPPGARPDLNVDGTIQLQRLSNILLTSRPPVSQENAIVGLFRLDAGGRSASRVQVRFGRVSVNSVEIISGLKQGDRVVVSDMSQWDDRERIRIR